ncbi:hypothetical protein CYLTODRAFT_252393 [Cylindrobasidium torrendii FP15055 ss-10]|uniref:Luciferase domain-containing protein n=1 Tax=Cylindrobasidium torrendii FP15055 ss-10 TaxID=1314674 RepID=A0A0D7BDY8_9AGAR|nr:hypothetical protein CYLTODRAFT_252393 [Cylindrobasidium torrendii FP15055 ss-10]
MSHFAALVARHPRAIIATGLVGLSLEWAVDNYRKYLSLGEGGFPYNPLGWFMATLATAFSRETLSITEYESDFSSAVYLDASKIPERRGSRPTLGWHAIPHRQVDRLPSPDIREKLVATFNQLALANATFVQLDTSPHERDHQGMLLSSSVTEPHHVAVRAWREIGHIHPSDSSMHWVLSPADCALVVAKGWGERHPLSGVSRHCPLPKEYLMIYAPRDEEELSVCEQIMVASMQYMSGTREVSRLSTADEAKDGFSYIE